MAENRYTPDQEKIIKHRGSNLLVSAGAGSGKTMVLTEYVIGLITDPVSPVDIDRLLVLTFTKKAAAEMRERISGLLDRLLEKDPQNTILSGQRARLPISHISTIDSFCSWVLKNNIEISGVDPDFRMLDGTEEKIIKRQVFEDLLEEKLSLADPEFYHFIDSFSDGKNFDILYSLVDRFDSSAESYEDPEGIIDEACEATANEYESVADVPIVKLYLELFSLELEKCMEIMSGYAESFADEDSKKHYDIYIKDSGIIRSFLDCDNYNDLLILLENCSFPARPRKAEEFSEEAAQYYAFREHLKNTVKKYKDFICEDDTSSLNAAARLIGQFLEFVKEFRARLSAVKKENGIMNFSDVEHTVYDLLSDNADVAAGYRDYFEQIIVDEYQDSNNLQENILRLIARPDNYFMVGDLKQSIYGFRNASPELFLSKFEEYSYNGNSAGKKISLLENFRCRAEVIDSVNEIFDSLMTKDFSGVDYKNDARLIFGQKDLYGTEIHGFYKSEYYKIFCRESSILNQARLIEEKIRDMMDPASDFMITPKELGGAARKPVFRDFAVLVRANETGKIIKNYLCNHGIPAVVSKNQNFFNSSEISVVISFLKILVNPRQDIPLLAVMLSPIFDFTEDELALIRSADKQAALYEVIAASANEKCVRFIDFYKRYRAYAIYDDIYTLIERFLNETGYYYYMRAMKDGQVRASNLDMLKNIARKYADTSFAGVFDFIQYVEEFKPGSDDLESASILSETDDVVRVNTIHSSKGLEYPVVFLAGAEKSFITDSKDEIVGNRRFGYAKKSKSPKETKDAGKLVNELFKEEIKKDTVNEQLRLFYVALTRAREKLIVIAKSGNDINRKKSALPFPDLKRNKVTTGILSGISSFKGFMDAVTGNGAEYWNVYERDYNEEESGEETAAGPDRSAAGSRMNKDTLLDGVDEVSDPALKAAIEEALSFEYGGHSFGVKAAYSVSELKKSSYGDVPEEEQKIHRLYGSGDPDAAAIGTACHLVFEKLDYTKPIGIDSMAALISELTASGLIEEKVASKVSPAKITAFFDTEIGQKAIDAAAAGRLYRERPFLLGVKPCEIDPASNDDSIVVVQGVIDMYFIEDDGITIVDYKTDFVQSGEEEMLKKRYNLQLGYYARALKAAHKKNIKTKYIYSVMLEKCIII